MSDAEPVPAESESAALEPPPAVPADLAARARAWIDGDPDAETRRELEALLDAADVPALRDRLDAELAFGTAGLRGVMGAGPNRMNRAVVLRATRGLADQLLSRTPDGRTLPVVVGHDARIGSAGFAEDTANVLAAAGIPVRRFVQPAPTPLVAFAARALGASRAVVVTASHNPPEYNGYKAYGADAVQIVPPVDVEIAQRIAAVGPARAIPLEPRAEITAVPASLEARYLDEIDAARPRVERDTGIGIVYTPLHGVGGALALKALSRAGYTQVHAVAAQFEPDGAFPTVRFPNPEEPGALDLALALAAEKGADLILANDPDADRLAVCVRDGDTLRPLSGNQIGLLLADYLLTHAAPHPGRMVLSSIVSSPMLASVARAHGARHESTLTGFKWIWTAALALERSATAALEPTGRPAAKPAPRFVFGYEEALGYCVGPAVRDKDGISAAVVFADLAAQARKAGRSVAAVLADLYRKHGVWVSAQHTVVRTGVEGASALLAAVDRLAAAPPTTVGEHAVTRVVDYRQGAAERPPWLGATPLVELTLGERGRVLVRPSGTEPKLKIYVDLCHPAPAEGPLAATEAAAHAEALALARAVGESLGL